MTSLKHLPALHHVPALLPTVISEVTQHAVDELLREGSSQNTLASYRSALKYWAAWFGMRYGLPVTLPLPPAAVLQFIVDHAARMTDHSLRHELPPAIDQALVDSGFKGKPGPMALNTLMHRISVLSQAHRLRKLPNPVLDIKVAELLARTRRAYAKRGERPQRKDALTVDPLQALLATCDNSLRGVRDRALLLFAWSTGGRRRSEVALADIRFLKPAGAGAYEYELFHSKTNQSGTQRQDNFKPVVGEAAEALNAWLRAAQITEGKIFRRIRKGGHIGDSLTAAAVRQVVLDRCALAGVNGDFSAHSLRSGFVTEAGRQGASIVDTMGMTGHRSVAGISPYFRADFASRRSLAEQLLGKNVRLHTHV